MAKIQSSGLMAFDINHLNLDDVFVGKTTTASSNNGPLTQAGGVTVIGSTLFTLPSHNLHVTTLVSLENAAGVTQSLMGNSFGYDSKGALVSGTISLLWGPGLFLNGVSVLGMALDVADFLAVAQTRGNRDDAQMMLRVFAGNDLVDGTSFDDVYAMGTGKDQIHAGAGNDYVLAGGGDDWVMSDMGDDTLLGQEGRDILINDGGSDQMFGGSGRDLLVAGNGFDTLTGGQGADRFVFQFGFGHSTITDFADGRDKLALVGMVTNWHDLTLTQVGADVKISSGAQWVVVQNLDVSQLSRADFVLDDAVIDRAEIAFMTGWDYLL